MYNRRATQNKQTKSRAGIPGEDEVDYAPKQMKNGSAPGNERITVEFLEVFWSVIRKTVL